MLRCGDCDASGKINVRKAKGRLENLEELLRQSPLEGSVGIGHTRWATHGEPSDLSLAHPHTDVRGGIAVVHNGIIENHAALRRHLESTGAVFCEPNGYGGCGASFTLAL